MEVDGGDMRTKANTALAFIQELVKKVNELVPGVRTTDLYLHIGCGYFE